MSSIKIFTIRLSLEINLGDFMPLKTFIFSLLFSFSLCAETFEGYTILVKAENEKSFPVILVHPSKLLPTQMAIGQAMVNDMIQNRFGEHAFADAKLAWDKNKDLEKNLLSLNSEKLFAYVKAIQIKLDKKNIDGAFTTKGIYHFDGHHRSRAIYEVNKILSSLTKDERIQVLIPIHLIANYSNPLLSDKKIAEDIFITKSQGYVSLSAIKNPSHVSSKKLALLKYKYLQKNSPDLGALPDDPYRSLIGKVLFKEGIESDSFVTYFEFHLEELFKTEIDKALKPVQVRPGMAIDDAMVKKVKEVMFSDPKIVHKIAYWARIGNLSKQEAFERCTSLEKKDDKIESSEELKEESICKTNKEILERVSVKQ